jgi:hypothetical protein
MRAEQADAAEQHAPERIAVPEFDPRPADAGGDGRDAPPQRNEERMLHVE